MSSMFFIQFGKIFANSFKYNADDAHNADSRRFFIHEAHELFRISPIENHKKIRVNSCLIREIRGLTLHH